MLPVSEEKPIFIFFHIWHFNRTIHHCYWQLDWMLIYSRNIYLNILAEAESGWGWTRDVSLSAASLVPLCYKQPRCTITLCLIKSNKASNFDVHTQKGVVNFLICFYNQIWPFVITRVKHFVSIHSTVSVQEFHDNILLNMFHIIKILFSLDVLDCPGQVDFLACHAIWE